MKNYNKIFKKKLSKKEIGKVELVPMYCKDYDITFIMKYTNYIDGTISEEVTGFYYGEPNLQATEAFNGNSLAVFDNPYN